VECVQIPHRKIDEGFEELEQAEKEAKQAFDELGAMSQECRDACKHVDSIRQEYFSRVNDKE